MNNLSANKKLWIGIGGVFVVAMGAKQALWGYVRGEVVRAQNLEHSRACMEAELSRLTRKHARIEEHLRREGKEVHLAAVSRSDGN